MAYGGEYLAHKKRDHTWWVNSLYPLKGKHVAVDMNQKPEALGVALTKMVERGGPYDPGHGDGPEDDDDHGGGPGGDGGTRRQGRVDGSGSTRRSDSVEIHDMVATTTGHTMFPQEEEEQPVEEVPEQPEEELGVENDEEETESDDLAVVALPDELEDSMTGWNGFPRELKISGTIPEPVIKEKKNDGGERGALGVDESLVKMGVALLMKGGMKVNTAPTNEPWRRSSAAPRLCGVPWCVHGHMCREDRHRRPQCRDDAMTFEVRAVPKEDEESSRLDRESELISEPQDVEQAVVDGIGETGNSRSKDGKEEDSERTEGHVEQNVFMVQLDGGVGEHDQPLRHRLAALAQRLTGLRSRLGNDLPADPIQRFGSPTRGMAMSRSSHSRTSSKQSTCQLADLQEVRPSIGLHVEAGHARRIQELGTTSRVGDGSPSRVAGDLHGGGDERADLSGQGDGDQRATSGCQPWCRESPDRCEGQHPGRSADCGEPDGLSSPKGKGQSEGQDDYSANNKDNYQEHLPNSEHGGTFYSFDGEDNKVRGGARGDDHGGACGRAGIGRAGDGSSSFGSAGVKGLWMALQRLREKMMQSDHGNNGPNPSTTNNTDTRQPQMASHGDGINNDTTNLHGTTKDILSVVNATKKEILPPLARKLAKAATLTAVLMNPVRDVFAAMENKYDLVEVACAPTSQLTQTFEGANYECLRVNQLTGYNLDTKKGTFELHQELRRKPAKLAWISLPCTRLTALQNLTERDEIQMAKYQKRLGQDLRRSDEVADSMEPVLETGGDFAWEWPTTAVKGWRSKAIRKLERLARK